MYFFRTILQRSCNTSNKKGAGIMKDKTLRPVKQKKPHGQKLQKLYQRILKAQKTMILPIWSVQFGALKFKR